MMIVKIYQTDVDGDAWPSRQRGNQRRVHAQYRRSILRP